MDHNELTNRRVCAIARTYGYSVDEVHAALDRHPIELDRDKYLKRTLALELMRLEQLEMAFEGKALRDRDVASGVLMVKIAERRATLLGLNPPLGHAVQVIQHVPEYQKSTTDEIEAAIDRIITSQRKPEPDGNGELH